MTKFIKKGIEVTVIIREPAYERKRVFKGDDPRKVCSEAADFAATWPNRLREAGVLP